MRSPIYPTIVWLGAVVICLTLPPSTSAQDFQIRDITDHVVVFTDPESGESQIVLQTERGLVVFNTFGSVIPAQRFKDNIRTALEREDFAYTLNMFDRLDFMGGNAAYDETMIIGHENLVAKYQGKDDEVKAEIQELIDMWRWKEDVARERLDEHEEGSEEALNEQRWITYCKRRADELEQGFSLVLPDTSYADRMTLDLGDVTLNLIWIGTAGDYTGTTVAVIPEDELAIIPHNIMAPGHLAPFPHPNYAELDVDRWITVLEELLESDDAVATVLCHTTHVWSNARARTHLEYIRRLWNATTAAAAADKSLDEIQEELSLDGAFAFVKEMPTYDDDDWFRPQHKTHVRLFFLQHQDLASELIRERGWESLSRSLAEIRKQLAEGGDIYVDETSINALGYDLMAQERFADAIAVLTLNVEVYPNSANAYDSLAEAFMKNGDTQKAIENYNKSLQLNPENDNAREMLDQLERS
jgi:tetratricopeptide (TPR) repeat protein